MQPAQAEARNFLNKVRSAIRCLNYEVWDTKWKYRQTLASLGILEEDVLEDISNLTEREYWDKDPDDNPAFSGYVWKCKKYLHGSEIYIKLKIKVDENGKLIIMSYHFDGM